MRPLIEEEIKCQAVIEITWVLNPRLYIELCLLQIYLLRILVKKFSQYNLYFIIKGSERAWLISHQLIKHKA